MESRVQVVPAEDRDAEDIAVLAARIWRRHYPGIISGAQIGYMLAQRYTPRLLRQQLASPGNWWDKLLADEELAGFSNYFLSEEPGEMKLDKIYVHQAHQRKGYGGMLLSRALQVSRAQGCARLILAVNRRNYNAIAFYRKHGFRIVDSAVKDIGGGFVMDDYIMALVISGS